MEDANNNRDPLFDNEKDVPLVSDEDFELSQQDIAEEQQQQHLYEKQCGICGQDRIDGHCGFCFPDPIEALEQSKNPSKGADAFYQEWVNQQQKTQVKDTDVVSEWKLLCIDPGFDNAGIAWCTCRRYGNKRVTATFHKDKITKAAMIPSDTELNKDAHIDVVQISKFFREVFRDVKPDEQVVVVFESQFFRPVPVNLAFLSCRLYMLHRLANAEINHLSSEGRNVIAFNEASSAVSSYFDKEYEKVRVPLTDITKEKQYTPRYAKKKKSIKYVKQFFGYAANNDHEADAILTGVYYLRQLNKNVEVFFE